MLDNEIAILQDTLKILDKGSYSLGGHVIPLKLTREQMEEAVVLLPREVGLVRETNDRLRTIITGRCHYSCLNEDAFSVARKQAASLYPWRKNGRPVLVLNLANPVHPGGGVRGGALAQEEDLCRKSSLLLSLEGQKARPYYEYNRNLHSDMGSDAVIIHPWVEIIRDEKNNLLPETVIVAVMTCAAPFMPQGRTDMPGENYEQMMYRRIEGMLKTAAYYGYDHLVLGAFGCGVFGNDAHTVSDLFYRVLKEFNFSGMREKDVFRRIDFAVLDRTESQYNYREFARNFDHFYRDADRAEEERALKEKKEKEIHLDAIRGCLIGGAVGDALGFPVEFLRERGISKRYGPRGITSYELSPYTGKALITDDTQMTLFTANGLLVGDTRGALRGIQGWPRGYVARAYQDWLKTQNCAPEDMKNKERTCWLMDVEGLYARRAPGNTCLSALEKGTMQADYIKTAGTDSKGCGGVMRVAPLGLYWHDGDMKKLDMEGAQLAAITHGHSLGYMPAAVLVHVINRIVFPPQGREMTLKEIVTEARDTVKTIFSSDPHIGKLTDGIDLAVDLAENEKDDVINIHRLGEGWVGDEALTISLYCALRHQDDFTAGVIAAVNHNGDSDSTGAITGNILGALWGYDAIEEKWKTDLEMRDVILEIADDLCHGCVMTEYGSYRDQEWLRKYVDGRKNTEG